MVYLWLCEYICKIIGEFMYLYVGVLASCDYKYFSIRISNYVFIYICVDMCVYVQAYVCVCVFLWTCWDV